jgi:hypothetical protein
MTPPRTHHGRRQVEAAAEPVDTLGTATGLSRGPPGLAFRLTVVGRVAKARPLIDAALDQDPSCGDAFMVSRFQHFVHARIPENLETFDTMGAIGVLGSIAGL